MTIEEAKLNEGLVRLVTDPGGTDHVTATNPALLPPFGTWTIDPGHSSVSLAWRSFRHWTITWRLHCLGVVHLDDLPPIGSIQFQQPSGLPVLTVALDPASVETHDADLDARLRSSEVFDVLRHRWWTLRSESLELLPNGTWRVMTALTAKGTSGPVELRLEVDPAASSADWLVLRGHGLLDRRAFGIGAPVWTFSSQIRLDVAVRARREGGPISAPRGRGSTCTTSMPG
jgi:polyisoprenoid-binding protein YceI